MSNKNFTNVKLLRLSIFFVLVAAMVCNSFVAVLATSDFSNDSQRPVSFEEFCQMYAMYISNGDADEYERMYKVMISAGLTKGVPTDIPVASESSHAVVPTADGGWALQTTELNERASAGTQTTLANYYWESEVPSPPTQYGWVTMDSYSIGSPNGACAGLHTVGCTDDFAGEAILNGDFGRICTGPIEVWARSLQAGDNYFVVWSQLSGGAWDYIGAGQTTSTSIHKFSFPTNNQFDRSSVNCCTMPPPYPPGSHMLINHVGVDAVGAY